MGYISDDVRWFIADIVLETQVVGNNQIVIHVNTTLIRANSAERAFIRANNLGKESEHVYENTDGHKVRVVYCGLNDLYAIQENLKHGAELSCREEIGLTEEQVQGLVKPKEYLSAFSDFHEASFVKPNYMPRAVAERLKATGFDTISL